MSLAMQEEGAIATSLLFVMGEFLPSREHLLLSGSTTRFLSTVTCPFNSTPKMTTRVKHQYDAC